MEKQIEEMAKIPESEMGMSGYSKFSWKLWEAGICTMAEAEKADQIMRKMGYRKASDVAREIFEEIEDIFQNEINQYSNLFKETTDPRFRQEYMCAENALDWAWIKTIELKKKYTEGEG